MGKLPRSTVQAKQTETRTTETSGSFAEEINSPKVPKGALSIGQAASRLGVSVDTIRNWETQGKISSFRTAGGIRKFKVSEINRLAAVKNPKVISTPTVQTKTQPTADENNATGLQKLDQILNHRTPQAYDGPNYKLLSHPIPEIDLPEPSKTVANDQADVFFNEAFNLTPAKAGRGALAGSILTTIVAVSVLAIGYIYNPTVTHNITHSSIASSILKPFDQIASVGLRALLPRQAQAELESLHRQDQLAQIQPSQGQVSAQDLNNILGTTIASGSAYLEINSDVKISGNLTASNLVTGVTGGGLIQITGDPTKPTITLQSDLTGITSIANSGSYTQTGTSPNTFTGPTNFSAITTFNNNVGIGTTAAAKNPTKTLYVAGTFQATGDSTLGGALTISGDLAESGALKISGTSTLSGDTEIGGSTTLDSTLKVSGSTTLSSSLAVSGTSTLSGNTIISAAGSAGNPALSLTGSWLAGATPQMLVQPTGTTSTSWSSNGTALGVNSASTFTGNLLDLQKNGSSVFSVDSRGNVSVGGAITVGGTVTYSTLSATSLSLSGPNPSISTSNTNSDLTIDANGTGQVKIGGTSTGDILLGGGTGSTGCTVTNSNGNFSCYGSIQVQSANSGAHLLSGTGAPSSGVGSNGDYYFRTDGTNSSSTLYYKLSGSWVSAGGGSLQNAYDIGNTINTSSGNNVAVTLSSGLVTPTSFSITNAGTATALILNDTNVATNTSLDIQSGGVSKFSVLEDGTLTTSGNINGQTISSAANFTGSLAVANGLTVSAGGASITGTTNINTTGTANTAIGNGTGTTSITSSAWSVSTAGAAVFNTLAVGSSSQLSVDNTGALSTSGNISTTGTGTITSAGLLTASNGLTVSSGTTSITGATNINISGSAATSIGTGTGNLTLGNSTGTTSITGSTWSISTLGAATVTSLNAGSGTIQTTGAGSFGTLSAGSAGQLTVNSSGTVSTSGNVSTTGIGTITSAGLLTGNGGLTVTGGTANINTSGTASTAIGNSSGTFQLTSTGLNVSTAGTVTGVTTLSAATSITTPTIYGGTGISSSLSLAGTSNGTPSGANIFLNSAGQGNVGIGTSTASTGLLVVGSTGQLTVSSAGTLATTGNISTTGTGTITSAGLLTGSAGITVTGGTANINSTGTANTAIGNSTGTTSITGSTWSISTLGAASLTSVNAGSGTIQTTGAGNFGTGAFGSAGQLTINSSGTLSTSGNLATTGTGTITSAGLLTASNGFTVSSGTTSITGATNINTSGSAATSIGTGTGNLTLGNSTGTTSITGSTWSISTLGAASLTSVNAGSGTIQTTGAGNFGSLSVGSSGQLTINSSGLLSTTGGLTVTGTISLNDNASTNTTSIGGGSTTGAVTIGGTGTQTLNIGNGVGVKTVNLGSSNTTSTTTILSGSGGLSLSSAGASSFSVTGANLTLQTLTSGTLAVSSAGALNLTGAAASTFTFPANTAGALQWGDPSHTYFTLNTQTGTSGVSAFTFTPGSAPTIASSATADYNTFTVTPPTITLTGTTSVTSLMKSVVFNAPTIADSSVASITSAATVYIAGAPTQSGSASITNGYALYSNSGLNYFGGNVGIGTTSVGSGYLVVGSTGQLTISSVGTLSTTGNILTTSGGTITSAGLLTASNGFTASGTVSINDNNSTNTTSIGGGTTTGQVTIGGTGTQTIAVGNGAGIKTVQVGSSNSSSTTTLLSGSGGLSLNASNNQPTNINTGTSTGAVSIGNSSAGALTFASGTASSLIVTGANLTLQTATSGTLAVSSAGALNLTGNAASTLNVGSGNTLAITSSSLQLSTAGVLSLPGAQTTDITTLTAGNGLTVQPASSSGASGTGGALALNGGTQSGTGGTGGAVSITAGSATGASGTRTGGNVGINAGTGASSNGSINIGNTTAKAINLGNSTDNTTLTLTGSGLTTLGGSLQINGGNINDSSSTTRLTLGSTTTLTNSTLNLTGTASIGATSLSTFTTSSSLSLNPNSGGTYTLDTSATTLNLFNTTPTSISFGGNASTINIGPGGSTATTVNIAGGSGATGCTVDGATGNLTCTGSVSGVGGTNTNLTITPTTDSTALTLQGDTHVTSAKLAYFRAYNATGTIFDISYPTVQTLTGSLIGQSIDLNNGQVTATNQNVTGELIKLPTITNTNAAGTVNLKNLSLSFGSGAGINQNGAGSTIWTALDAQLPALTQTSGSLTANGVLVTTSSSITTGGTANGINIAASGVGAGTLNGINISSITGGAGTESALAVGSGWDNVLTVGGTTIINGSGVTQSAGGGTGFSTYAKGDLVYASAVNTLAKLAAGSTGNVLTISGGVPIWSTISGGAGGTCTDCMINDPTTSAPNTIAPTGASTTGLIVKQTSTASPTGDIFDVTSSDGLTKYFYIDNNGNVSSGVGSNSSTITVTPNTDTTALTLVGTNVSTANLAYFNSKNQQGNILKIGYGAAQTLSTSTALYGINMDLSTNVTATNALVNGFNILLPGATNTNTTGTKTIEGIIIAGGNLNQNAAGATTYTGADITIPALTQTSGSLTANGVLVTTSSSITTGGTANGINISASGVGAGSLTGVNISNITAGAGTEKAITIGTGWDNGIVSSTTGISTFAGNIGIGTTSASGGLLNVGSSSQLTINSSGTLSTTGNISTTSSGTITSASTLTASNGFTMTTGALSFTATSGTISATGLSGTNITNSSGNLTLGATNGAVNITAFTASTFALGANTANALKITDGTNAYLTINTQTGTSGVSAFTYATTAPTIASAAGAQFINTTITPGTYNFTGSTGVTGTGTSSNTGLLINQLSLSENNSNTFSEASDVIINGAVRAVASAGTNTITNSYGLNILAGSALNGTGGAVTNGYGLSVNAPTGATNNYAAIFQGGNVGIGTTAPGQLLDVYGNMQIRNSGNLTISGNNQQVYLANGGRIQGTYANWAVANDGSDTSYWGWNIYYDGAASTYKWQNTNSQGGAVLRLGNDRQLNLFYVAGASTQGSAIASLGTAVWSINSSGGQTINNSSGTGLTIASGLTVSAGGASVTGTTNINTSGSAATSIGTGTGNTAVGNSTGTTSITGSTWSITTLGAATLTSVNAGSGTIQTTGAGNFGSLAVGSSGQLTVNTSGNLSTSGTITLTTGGNGVTNSGGNLALNANTGASVLLQAGGTNYILVNSSGITLQNASTFDVSTQATTFKLKSNTQNALQITDGTNSYLTIDTRTGTSGVSAFTHAVTAPTIASAAGAQFINTTITPGTVNFTGTTNITGTGTSSNLGLLLNQLTLSGNNTNTISESSNVLINGAVKSTSSVGTQTITNSYGLNILAGAALNGTGGAVTNGYGLSVNAPTGATNNYAAVFNGGNVGIGTTLPSQQLEIAKSAAGALGPVIQLRNTGGASADQGAINFATGTGTSGTELRAQLTFNILSGGGGYMSFNTGAGGVTEKMRLGTTGGLSVGNSYVSTDPGAGSIIASGNIGIGTSSPSQLLEVKNTSGAANIQITDGGTAANTVLIGNRPFGATNAGIYTTGASTFTIGTNSTARINIDGTSGNIGIGTTGVTGGLLNIGSSGQMTISSAGTLSTTGNISTTSGGTITSAGLLTASNGLTMSTGALNITANAASTIALDPGITNSLQITDGSNPYLQIDTRTTTSGVVGTNITAPNQSLASGASTNYITLAVNPATVTLSGTTNVTSLTKGTIINSPLFNGTGPLTISNASTFYIAGAPTAGGGITITNGYALYSNSGLNYFGGNVAIGTTTATGGALTVGSSGQLTISSSGTLSTSGSISTTGTGSITSANGLTVSAGGASITGQYSTAASLVGLYTNGNGNTAGNNSLGIYSSPGFTVNSTTGLISGFYTYPTVTVNSATTLSELSGVHVANGSITNNGTITTRYGIYIEQPTGGSTNYSIYSAGAFNYFGGNVGIGTTTQSTPLNVNQTISATSAQDIIASTVTFNGNSLTGVQTAVSANLTDSGTGSTDLRAGNFRVITSGASGTAASVTGLLGRTSNTGAGSVTVSQSLQALAENSGGGTISTQYGVLSQLSNSSGTVSNFYNFYASAPTGGGTTSNKYAFVSEAGAGNVGIGTTAPGSPLTVKGAGGGLTGLSVIDGTNTGQFFVGASGGLTAAHIGSSNNIPLSFFTNNSTPLMTLNTSGNLGIGTTSPNNKLVVASGSLVVGFNSGISNGDQIVLGGANPARLGFNIDAGTATQGRIEINNDASSGTSMRFSTFKSGSLTEQMRITDQGNVGIGTTVPNAILQVGSGTTSPFATVTDGSARYGSYIAPTYAWTTANPTNAYGGYNSTRVGPGTGITLTNAYGEYIDTLLKVNAGAGTGTVTNAYGLYVNLPTAATNNYAAYFGGNVGVGTATPGALIDAYQSNTGATYIRVTNPTAGTANYAQFQAVSDTVNTNIFSLSSTFTTSGDAVQAGSVLRGNGSGGFSISANNAAGIIRMYTGGIASGNERLRIDSSGIVGVGATSPSSFSDRLTVENDSGTNPLTVVNNTVGAWAFKKVRSDNSNAMGIYDPSGFGVMALYTAGSERIRVDSGGNVGIDTTTTNYPLTVAQSVNNAQPLSLANLSAHSTSNNDSLVFSIKDSTDTLQNFAQIVVNSSTVNGTASQDRATMSFYTNSGSAVGINRLSLASGLTVNNSSGAQPTGGDEGPGTINVTGGFYINGVAVGTGATQWTTSGSSIYYNTGNVGIGTTSPGQLLTVYSASGNGQIVAQTGSTGNANAAIQFVGGSANANWQIGTQRADLFGAAANLGFYNVGGSGTAMVISQAGNVGIGTTAPAAKLDVYGNGQFTGTQGLFVIANTSSDTAAVRLYNATPTATAFFAHISTANNFFTGTAINDTALGNSINNGSLYIGTTTGSGNVVFKVGDSEKMRINSSGNVGIGTTNPISPGGLDIAGTGATLVLDANGSNSTSQALYFRNTGSAPGVIQYSQYLNFQTSAGTPQITFSAAGNIGIGTTAPSRSLAIQSGASATSNQYLSFMANGSERSVIGDEESTTPKRPFIIYDTAAGTYRLIIDSTGNIGIGTTAPTQKLEVAGSIKVQTGSGGSICFSDGTCQSTAAATGASATGVSTTSDAVINSSTTNTVQLQTAGTARLYVANGGNVGIGTTGPHTLLDVYGSSASGFGQLTVRDNTSATTDVGGSLTLGGYYSGTSSIASFAQIKGGKSNSTAGDYGGYLALSTQVNGGSLTERMRIDTAGNVAIGTTSTTSILTVAKTSAGAETTGLSLQNLSDTAGTAVGINFQPHSTGTTLAKILANRTALSGGLTNLQFYTYSDSISPSGLNERMRIQSDGNVGIGTTSPLASLAIAGTTLALGSNQTFGYNFYIGTTNPSIFLDGGNSGTSSVQLQARSAGGVVKGVKIESVNSGNDLAIVPGDNPGSGNVGIGSAAPGTTLDVTGTFRTSGAATLSSTLAVTGATTLSSTLSVTGNATFTTLNTANGVIYANGSGTLLNTGAGTTGQCLVATTGSNPTWGSCAGSSQQTSVWSALTNPSGNLSLAMASNTTTFTYNSATSTNNLFTLTDTSSNTGTGYLATFATATGSSLNPFRIQRQGNTEFFMDSTGNVGIGTSSQNYAKLAVIGTTILQDSSNAGTSTRGLLLIPAASGTNYQTIRGTGTTKALYLTSYNTNQGTNPVNIDLNPQGYIAFNTNTTVGDGVEHMRLDSTGNLGIGSTNPLATLQIENPQTYQSFPTSILIRNSSAATLGNDAAGITFQTENELGQYGSYNTSGIYDVVDAGGNRHALDFRVTGGGSSQMNSVLYLRGDGNVGIGTTNPLNQLHVVGGNGTQIALDTTATNNQTSIMFRSNGIEKWDLGTDVSGNGTKNFFIYDKTANSTRLLIDTSGNVGIGTTNPTNILEVYKASPAVYVTDSGTSYSQFALRNNNSTLYLGQENSAGGAILAGSSAYAGVIDMANNNALQFGTNNAVRMTIANGGNVGIGNTNPGFHLDVVPASSIVASAVHPELKLGLAGTGQRDIAFYQVVNSGANALDNYITFTGNLDTGNTSFGTPKCSSGFSGCMGVEGADGSIRFFGSSTSGNNVTPNTIMTLASNGNVGISTTTANHTLAVAGSVAATGTITQSCACTPDVAEYIKVSDTSIAAADVVIADPNNTETAAKPQQPYDPRIIGVISTDPKLVIGAPVHDFDPSQPDDSINKRPLALAGRVPVKVNTENGPIVKGDYLTTSSTPGVAMKATRPGPTLGKALGDFNGTGTGSILVFVNVSYADPSNALANLTVDSDGSLIVPKLKAGSITVDGNFGIAGDSQNGHLTINEVLSNATTAVTDVALKMRTLETDLATVQSQQDVLGTQVASQSAQIADLQAQNATASAAIASNSADIASATAQLATTQSAIDDLKAKLTAPDVMFATQSGNFKEINVADTTSTMNLSTIDATVSGTFKALGDSFMSNTTVAGDLVVDGTYSVTSVTGGNAVNALSTLFIQNNPLAQLVDFFNGLVTIDKTGTLTAQTVKTQDIQLKAGKSSGSGIMTAGTSSVDIPSTLVHSTSRILVTITSGSDAVLRVSSKVDGTKFTVSTSSPVAQDTDFDWVIINEAQ